VLLGEGRKQRLRAETMKAEKKSGESLFSSHVVNRRENNT
jgi:hypothetical protein